VEVLVRRFVFLAALMLASCAEPPKPHVPGTVEKEGKTALTVEGEVITEDMLTAVTRRIPPEQMTQLKANPDQYKQFLERVALGQALYKKALDQKLHEDPEIQRTIAMAEREILASELLEKVGKDAVTDDKIKEAYEKHKVQYAKPSVKVQHLLVKDEATAKDLVGQLKAGADFATLAKQHSLDGGGDSGNGDLGWVQKGRLIPELSDPAFAGNPGDIVGPISTRHGFHVIKVNEKRDATPIEEVRPQLEETVKKEAIEGYMETLKKDMKVEYGEAGGKAEVAPMPSETPSDAPPAAPAAPAAPPAEAPPAAGH
jgi:peptidyl-prolyl cis-trans isomerase C